MREILYHGKRVDNGEWVEGLPYEVDGVVNRIRVKEVIDDIIAYTTYPVIPETVGQYIYLNDKNGTKIFEGNILKGYQYPFFHDGKHNYFAEVIWFDNSPAFGIYTFKNPSSEVAGISTGNCDYLEDFASANWEVIGNIYDNPDLWKK